MTGLENILPESIASLTITNNPLLSECNIQSICDYLIDPTGPVYINNNAAACNSPEEVLEVCQALQHSSGDFYTPSGFRISPNPGLGNIELTFTINEPGVVHIDLYETSGVRIKKLFNDEKDPGTYNIKVVMNTLPAGIYFCTFKTINGTKTKKLIKQ